MSSTIKHELGRIEGTARRVLSATAREQASMDTEAWQTI